MSYAGSFGLSTVILAKIHSLSMLQSEIAKKSLKTPILGVKDRSRSSMLVPPESSSAVFVMISSKSVCICNRSHAGVVDSSINPVFSRGYPNLMRSYGGLLEPRGSKLHHQNLRLIVNIS